MTEPKQAACLLPSEHRLVVSELFFGRDIPGRGPVTSTEWTNFVARVIAANFPDGFTILDADGGWLDPWSGKLIRETSKLVIVAADPRSEPATRVNAVIAAYRHEFHQQSVGLVTRESCASFGAP